MRGNGSGQEERDWLQVTDCRIVNKVYRVCVEISIMMPIIHQVCKDGI
jgi:hypothetical protein